MILVHGCFWHGHDCHLFRWPASREVFWREKIAGNIARDERNRALLLEAGWRIAEVWECQLRGRERQPAGEVLGKLATFLESSRQRCVIGPDQTVSVASVDATILAT